MCYVSSKKHHGVQRQDKPEELEAMSEALAALQTLVEDISDDRSVPSKPLKPAADVPSAKGMARIDYFLVGEKWLGRKRLGW